MITTAIAIAAFALAAGLWVQRWWERRQARRVIVDAMRMAVQQRAIENQLVVIEPSPSWRTYPKGTN